MTQVTAVSIKHLKVYFALLLSIAIPFVLTFGTVEQSMTPPDFSFNPTPFGYTWSLTIFLVPVVLFFGWLGMNSKRRVELKAAVGCVLGVTVLGSILDFGFGYHFFRFPNTGSVLGLRLPAFNWEEFQWVPQYLPIEEFGFYLLGGTYMLCSYLWGVLYWFRRYNYPNHKARVKSLDKLIEFDFRLLALGVFIFSAGYLFKKFGPSPEGFPGYFAFQVFFAFLPIVFCFRVVNQLINWRAFTFMSFTLLMVSIVYEATLGVPYGWWLYNPNQMLGIFVTAWSGLPLEAILLWIAAGFGTVLLFEFLRAILYSDRSVKSAVFGNHRKGTFGDRFVDDTLPLYLDNGYGVPVPPGPYENTKGDLSNFLIKVDYAKVLGLVNKYLNNTTRDELNYVPFLNVVQATFATLQGYVNDSSGNKIGQLPEADLVFWIPCVAVRSWFGLPIPSHIAMFPYRLYVDSPYGLCSGREALGFFKNYAEFKTGDDPSNPDFSMSVLGFESKDPKKLGRMLPLVECKPSIQHPNSALLGSHSTPAVFQDKTDAIQKICKALKGPENGNVASGILAKVLEFVIDLVQPEVKCVSLKQFRDVSDPSRACLQQVVEIESQVMDFQGGGFYSQSYDLHFHPVVSDTLVQDLGIELENGVQKNVWGFWAKAVFNMGTGVVIR